MTTTRPPCDEIAADAMGLAALPAGAPERARAEAHALTCAACARSLAEAQVLLTMLDASLAAAPAPSAAALARARSAVVAELQTAAVARAGAGKLAGAVAAAVLAAWALPLALARGPLAGGSSFALSLGLAAVAAVASAATVRWGGRVAVIFPVLSAATALLVGTGNALDAAGGVHCALTEALTAAGVATVAWFAARGLARAGAPRPGLVAAAVGGGALAGHAALHLACPGATQLPHVLVFHTGPVVLGVGLALLVAASARRDEAVTGSSRP